MNRYLIANRARSVISRMNAYYHISAGSQQIGRLLQRKFNFQRPSFVISGITKGSLKKMGLSCYQLPCLLTVFDNRKVISQLIFGRILSPHYDSIVVNFPNRRSFLGTEIMGILAQVDRLNLRIASETKLLNQGRRVLIVDRLHQRTFVNSVIHLLQYQFAVQRGIAILDDGKRHDF